MGQIACNINYQRHRNYERCEKNREYLQGEIFKRDRVLVALVRREEKKRKNIGFK